MTVGQLDPKTGGGESGLEDQKTRNLIPFLFFGMYAQSSQVKNLFQEDPDGRLANSRPTATKERTLLQRPHTPQDEALDIDLWEIPKNPN